MERKGHTMRVTMLVLNDMRDDARVIREARSLSAAGHDVQVLALRSPDLPDVEDRDGFTVRRVADFTRAGLRQPARKLSERRARERALREAVIHSAPGVVHCHDTNTLDIGAPVARALGVPYVYDAHELYPDSLMQRPFQRSWVVQRYLRAAERRFIPGAAAVITVSDGHARVLNERYGVRPVIVANCPALAPVGDRMLLKRTLGVPAERVVALYQGGLQLGRAIDELVDALALVPALHLAVQGRGEYEGAMRQRVAERGIGDRVTFMGHLPHEQLFDLTCGADIGTLFLDGVTLNHRLTWPNRLFMYLMAGIPTAATDLPGASGVLSPAEAGLLAPPGDVDAMAAILARLAGDERLRQEMGARGRVIAEREYNWGVQEQRLLGVYERLCV
jgi:glycosyltransferase involved in cell wall biosynthesis